MTGPASGSPASSDDPAPVRYDPSWLRLREPADARARSRELAALAASELGGAARVVLHDLGCGTGSMARWLAPLLPGPQHWVLHDRDPDLLALATASMPRHAADGAPVTAEARRGDLTRLTAADLDAASLVTASALLDVLTAAEVDALVDACSARACPALLTLSVIGRVELTPADPLDAAVGAAFDAHQRRSIGDRALLGPDAVAVAAAGFRRRGARVDVRASPWRLRPGPADAALTGEWLRGWVGAAREHDPGLASDGYLARRLAAVQTGTLAAAVHHEDVLVRWG